MTDNPALRSIAERQKVMSGARRALKDDKSKAGYLMGVETKESVRQGLIELRDALLKSPEPRWEYITLMSHAIWWLDDD